MEDEPKEQLDLTSEVSFGVIYHGKLAQFIKLRDLCEKNLEAELIYETFSGSCLFLVKFRDLTLEKQQKILARR